MNIFIINGKKSNNFEKRGAPCVSDVSIQKNLLLKTCEIASFCTGKKIKFEKCKKP